MLEALNAHYRSLGSADRLHAQAVLVEWVLANDEKLRFDALAIIDEFKVVAAVPALLTLANRLKASATPAAPYELEKVRRIIARVRGHSSGD